MNDLTFAKSYVPLDPGKFRDPDVTARGEARARVALERLDTLWINTGTLCNITCVNCYIESSPTNDRLVYITAGDARAYLDEIADLRLGTREIGFTGGEPFMNPDILQLLEDALARGFEVLVLTNAMQPMQRPRIRAGLLRLRESYGERLVLRVSLDHYTAALHEAERGPDTFERTLAGVDWLAGNGFRIAIAGRSVWGEPDAVARAGYGALFADRGWSIDPGDTASLVIFPEMDARVDVPEITTACWGILGISPDAMMCATSRMVVKRRGEERPTVLPCTLLPYDAEFGMGSTLAQSLRADGGMFSGGAVKLCHPHCAKFCVLGGGSCAPA
ncbi:radical SAM protein [Microbaculum marinum]|uniref:Radical SAM protein n=1 Tax=Microbaculum marinum TaxID=1764581 RepID=A0AAW9RFV0_9HYPH